MGRTYTTISLDFDTAQKLKVMAGDKPLAQFIRDFVNGEYTSLSINSKLAAIEQKIDAIQKPIYNGFMAIKAASESRSNESER